MSKMFSFYRKRLKGKMKKHYLLMCMIILLSANWHLSAGVTLVSQGNPTAQIVISKTASDQIKNAANILSQYIELATGAKIPILTEDKLAQYHKGFAVHVGQTEFSLRQNILPKGLDDDGFVIVSKGQSIIILGSSDYGTEFGVYDFLEQYVGVRWLMPGINGTDIPEINTIEIPELTRSDAPVFFSRQASGFRGEQQGEWTKFNRMHGRVNFHHNLNSLFPRETYAENHPEFYPMKKGKSRYSPKDNNDYQWQPCFTAPGIIDEAVKNIIQYFNEHPLEKSYSLGINDSGFFCECPGCLSKISGKRNLINDIDYSDLYYDWCNTVVEGVVKVHPDKWFGCLAYHNVASAPVKVKLHPRLIPYLTQDRMMWIDEDMGSRGKAATEAWAKASPTIGWYDYIYGSPYCIPRIYFHHMQKYLQYAKSQGVKALYAESYPNWGEGPKSYVTLRLWWNPDQDVDKMLQEWYVRCVGEDAAPYLEKYYEIWERFWTKDILTSMWFVKGRENAEWLPFHDLEYLADVKKEDILESRKLLDICASKCKTSKQKARLEILEMAFRYYETSALTYLNDMEMRAKPITSESDALKALLVYENIAPLTQKRMDLVTKVFPNDPILVHPWKLSRGKTSEPVLGLQGLSRLSLWYKEGSLFQKRVQELLQKSDNEELRKALLEMTTSTKLIIDLTNGKFPVITENASFEEDNASGWIRWLKPEERPVGKMIICKDVAHSGKVSMLCDGMLRGAPCQTVDLIPPANGSYCALVWSYIPLEQDINLGHAEIKIELLEGSGKVYLTFTKPIYPIPGEWVPTVCGIDIPKSKITPAKIRLLLIVNDFQQGCGKIYFDDAGIYKIK